MMVISHMLRVPWLWLCTYVRTYVRRIAKNGSLSFFYSPQPMLRIGGWGVRRCHDTVIDLFSDYAKCDTHHDDVLSIEIFMEIIVFPWPYTLTVFSHVQRHHREGSAFGGEKRAKMQQPK